MKRALPYLLLFFTSTLLFSTLSCKKKVETKPQNFIPAEASDLTKEELKTIQTDTNYKYEYRTGSRGNYTYNYDVSGFDEQGKEVTGNVTMEEKYGFGTITTNNDEEIEVEVEWISYGELRATDQDGNQYELTVD